jgi:hypothetical protein
MISKDEIYQHPSEVLLHGSGAEKCQTEFQAAGRNPFNGECTV